jgi:hypothetical protein
VASLYNGRRDCNYSLYISGSISVNGWSDITASAIAARIEVAIERMEQGEHELATAALRRIAAFLPEHTLNSRRAAEDWVSGMRSSREERTEQSVEKDCNKCRLSCENLLRDMSEQSTSYKLSPESFPKNPPPAGDRASVSEDKKVLSC